MYYSEIRKKNYPRIMTIRVSEEVYQRLISLAPRNRKGRPNVSALARRLLYQKAGVNLPE
jgi:predicted CopG family antitoxin